MADGTYNGWKNRATWNVALWLNNDEALYAICVDYVQTVRERIYVSYSGLLRYAPQLEYLRTGDGYAFSSKELCRSELSDMLREMWGDFR